MITSNFRTKDGNTLYYMEPINSSGKIVVYWFDEYNNKDSWEYEEYEVIENFKEKAWYEVPAVNDPTQFGGQEAEHTGGSVNYYKVHVTNPTTLPEAYDAEANDIIESLGLTFAEGNLFKAIWRMAADRNGKKKKGNNSVYDAEKLVFFAERVLVQEKAKRDETV